MVFWCLSQRRAASAQTSMRKAWIYMKTKANIKTSSQTGYISMGANDILLTVPRRYFFCGSFVFFLSCVCYAFVRVCLYVPCGHLLGADLLALVCGV